MWKGMTLCLFPKGVYCLLVALLVNSLLSGCVSPSSSQRTVEVDSSQQAVEGEFTDLENEIQQEIEQDRSREPQKTRSLDKAQRRRETRTRDMQGPSTENARVIRSAASATGGIDSG